MTTKIPQKTLTEPAAGTTEGVKRTMHHFERVLRRENAEDGDKIWIPGEDDPFLFRFMRVKPDLHIRMDTLDGKACGLRRSLSDPSQIHYIPPETMVADRCTAPVLVQTDERHTVDAWDQINDDGTISAVEHLPEQETTAVSTPSYTLPKPAVSKCETSHGNVSTPSYPKPAVIRVGEDDAPSVRGLTYPKEVAVKRFPAEDDGATPGISYPAPSPTTSGKESPTSGGTQTRLSMF